MGVGLGMEGFGCVSICWVGNVWACPGKDRLDYVG